MSMPDKVTVYEKPTCSKCQEVKNLLTEKAVEFEVVNYFDQPLGPDRLKELLRAAGLRPKDAMRMNEAAYGELVAGKDLGDDELIRLMAEHPELVQRPIVVRGDRAVVARPVAELKKLNL
jgi:arsenate reductase (glutaredoxin)